jgi:hypothetical protein
MHRSFWWRVDAWTIEISSDLDLEASDLLSGVECVALSWLWWPLEAIAGEKNPLRHVQKLVVAHWRVDGDGSLTNL